MLETGEGEHLFISQRTEQPIPQAIAASLERHDAEHRKSIAR
ncbi:MAG: hypothetical protein OES47_09715 [Acidobacteriota bacterium]|nr:hypothetical protein [Acidobacteriota bacterium]